MSDQIISQYPLSVLQKRMWLKANDTVAFFKRCVLKITGELDVERLKASIALVVEKHAVLRTTYSAGPEFALPFQNVAETGKGYIFNFTDEEENDLSFQSFIDQYTSGYNTKNIETNTPLYAELVKLKQQEYGMLLYMPCIAADSFSIRKIISEIAAAYDNPGEFETNGGIQYFHFSEWHNDLLETGNEAADEFWSNYPFRANNEISLSFGQQTAMQTAAYSFAVARMQINPFVTGQLNQLAEMSGFPVSTILFAALSVLLQHHTRQDQFTIAYVNNSRSYEELADVVGLIANTLPVITAVDNKQSFMKHLENCSLELEKVLAWEEYYTWGSGVKDYAGNSNTDYKLEFEFSKLEAVAAGTGDVSFSLEQLGGISSRAELKFSFLDSGEVISIDCCYQVGLLQPEAVEIMGAQFITLLTNLIAAPGLPLEEVSFLSAAESETITTVFNTKARVEIPYGTIPEAFQYTVKNYPDAIAVKYNDEAINYRELNVQANQLAHYLTGTCHVQPGDIVALYMPRSLESVIAMLAIIKAGACYLPVDTNFPEERILYMIKDSNAKLVISSRAFEGLSVPLILPKLSSPAYKLCPESDPVVGITPQHPVYVIYTSGSTGMPKGVAISHTSLLNYTSWFFEKSGFTQQSSTLLISSMAYDLCYTSLWTSLLFGQTLSIVKETAVIDSGEIIRRLVDDKINYIKLSPTHFNIILNDPDFGKNCASMNLGLLVIGGEVINIDDVAVLMKMRPGIKLLHHYGPTETTVGTIAEMFDADQLSALKSKTVLGRPVTNSSVYILDKLSRLCPPGVTGEIAVAGKGLAIGYVNRPEITAAKFVPDPLNQGALMYLTGDLGRWMPDGTIEFIGRKDNQLKIRGFRIELGEIENTLLKVDGINKAIVLAIRNEKEEARLVAYLVADYKADNDNVVAFLSKYLPAYMLPEYFVWLDAYPVTQNGKVDRIALAAINIEDHSAGLYIPPVTIPEKKMAHIWKEILGREKIGISDNFFKLGGHSLKAAQLVSRVFKQTGCRIKLTDVFENPTIETLVAVIQQSQKALFEPVKVLDKRDTYDVSHAQKRLWFLDQFEDNQSAYNMHYAYWMKGVMDINDLEKAFEMVFRRHEILRTTFQMEAGKLQQKINEYEDCNFKIEYIDLRMTENPEAAAREYSKQSLGHIFNLKEGPLCMAILLHIKEDEHAFLLTMHHIISDGWSMRILMNELMIAYNLQLNAPGTDTYLPPLTIQYKDYAAWHNNIITGTEAAYWEKKIMNPPGLVNLPYDNIINTRVDIERTYVIHELDKESTRALRELAKEYNSTLSSIVLTVYSLFINKITGQSDFLIGVGHANRNHADLEGLIGFFVNLLVIRVQLSEEDTIESIARDVTQNCIEAYDHSNYPFDLLVEKFCSDRYSTRQPLLNVMYDFKGYSDLMLENDGFIDDSLLQITAMPKLRNIPKFDITLFVSDADETLQYYFEYNHLCFNESTISNFYRIFNELIQLILQKEPVPEY
jgi:amino acid adenylation domain-containing protein